MESLKRVIFLLVLPLVMFMPVSGITAPNVAADEYSLGKEMFNQGKYPEAAKHLNNVLSQGLKTPKLYYNLGSVYYKLEEYEKSHNYFSRLLTNKKMRDLAYYNLGLISNKVGHTNNAIKNFQLSNKYATNSDIKDLSSKQIKKIRKQPYEKQKNKKAGGSIYVSYGQDSNITTTPSASATNQSGSFTRLYGNIESVVTGVKSNGIIAYANLYARGYSDQYDYKYIRGGLSYRNPGKTWKHTYDLDIQDSNYGDEDYLKTLRLTAKTDAKISRNSNLRFKYSYEDIDSLNAKYDYLEGWRQRLGGEYKTTWTENKIRIQYEIEFNNRLNTISSNFSPTRHLLAFKHYKSINNKNRFITEINYRKSDYDPTATQNRSDNRLGLSVRHSYKPDNKWDISTSVSYKDNESTEDFYDYDKTVVTITLGRTF